MRCDNPYGFLFGTDGAKLALKENLLRKFNLHTIIRLPGSIFSPYTSIATNILFFNNEAADGCEEGFKTKETWFYRLDMPEGYKHFSKTKPMKVEHTLPIQEWWDNSAWFGIFILAPIIDSVHVTLVTKLLIIEAH